MHQSADGAASGIISLFEVCEVDFSRNRAQITAGEEVAADDYETVNKETEMEKTTKQQDFQNVSEIDRNVPEAH